jgi:hypothetical protein
MKMVDDGQPASYNDTKSIKKGRPESFGLRFRSSADTPSATRDLRIARTSLSTR